MRLPSSLLIDAPAPPPPLRVRLDARRAQKRSLLPPPLQRRGTRTKKAAFDSALPAKCQSDVVAFPLDDVEHCNPFFPRPPSYRTSTRLFALNALYVVEYSTPQTHTHTYAHIRTRASSSFLHCHPPTHTRALPSPLSLSLSTPAPQICTPTFTSELPPFRFFVSRAVPSSIFFAFSLSLCFTYLYRSHPSLLPALPNGSVW